MERSSRLSNPPRYNDAFERQYRQSAAELEEASTRLLAMPDMLNKLNDYKWLLRAEEFPSPREAHNNRIHEMRKQREHVEGQFDREDITESEVERNYATITELLAKEFSLNREFVKNRAQKQELAKKLLNEKRKYINALLQAQEAVQAVLSGWSPTGKARYPTPIARTSSPELHYESMDTSVGYGANAPRSKPSTPVEAARDVIRVSSDPSEIVGTEDENTTRPLLCSAAQARQTTNKKATEKRMSETETPRASVAFRAPRAPTSMDLNDEREIDFDKLYYNGKVLISSKVHLHPTGTYYILFCCEHNKAFRYANPWPSATSHFRSQHGDYSREACIRLFGVPVNNCNSESLMKEYNAAVRGCLAMERDYENDSQPTTQSTPCQTASAIDPSYSLQKEGQSDEENALITRPRAGCIFLSTWQQSDYALVVLPFGSLEPLGLPGSIVDTGLMHNQRRLCHDQDPATGRYIWSKGYEDGGPNESQREVPVLWIDHEGFPEHARYGWRRVCDLRKFDPSEKFQFQTKVSEYISQRKDLNPAFDTDCTEYYTGGQPSVPAVRDPVCRSLEIDAYFEDPIEIYSNSAEERDIDDSGDYVDDTSKRRHDVIQPPAKRLRTSAYNDRLSVAEMANEPHTVTPNTDERTPSQRVVDVDTNSMDEMINYEGPSASPTSKPKLWSYQQNDGLPSSNTLAQDSSDKDTQRYSSAEPVWDSGSRSRPATETFTEQRMMFDNMRNDSTKVSRGSEAAPYEM